MIFTSCAPPPAIKTTALVPGRFDGAAKLKEVAVLPFDGIGGRELTAEIEGILASISIHDKQYFTVVDRAKLNKVMDEMKLSHSALANPETAAKVGNLVGAKGIYTGTVNTAGSNDSYYKEMRIRCARYEKKQGKKGYEYEECVKSEEYEVSCTKRDAAFEFTPKLIDVATGRIVYANNVSGSTSASACQDSNQSITNASALIEQAKKIAKETFKKDIAPHYVQFEIKIIDSTDGITSQEAETKLEQGIEFAKSSRLDRACELWGEARALSPNSLAIFYSLGICAEVIGDFEQALDLYKKADRLLSKPDDRITAAIYRVSDAVNKQKKLKEQMGK